jgi:hypothetical protein
MRAVRIVSMGAMAISLAACSDDVFGPWGSEGFYDLRTANGVRVPAVVFDRSGNNELTVTMVGGELVLRGDDSFRLDIDYEEWDGRTETRYTQGIAGTWEWEGDEIFLDYRDPFTGNWEYLAATKRHDDVELLIPGAVAGSSIRVVFRR